MPICQGKRSRRCCHFHFLKEDIDHHHVQAGEGAGGGRQHPGEQRWDHGEVFIIVLSLDRPQSLFDSYLKNFTAKLDCLVVTVLCFTFLSFKKVIKQLMQHSDSEVQDTMDVSQLLLCKIYHREANLVQGNQCNSVINREFQNQVCLFFINCVI